MRVQLIVGGIYRVQCPGLPEQLWLDFTEPPVTIQRVLERVALEYGLSTVREALVAVNHVLVQDNAQELPDNCIMHIFSPAFGG